MGLRVFNIVHLWTDLKARVNACHLKLVSRPLWNFFSELDPSSLNYAISVIFCVYNSRDSTGKLSSRTEFKSECLNYFSINRILKIFLHCSCMHKKRIFDSVKETR